MLCVLFLFRVFYNFPAFIMNNFRHRVLRIEPNNAAVQKGASRSTQFASWTSSTIGGGGGSVTYLTNPLVKCDELGASLPTM